MAAIRRNAVLIGLVPAHALDLAFLDRAQQLGLQVEPQIADLVEEQRAARGELELAELLPVRAGERAALVAEERALGQLARNRREVHRDERRVRIAGLAVDQPRQQLLAGAALAEDQHRRRQLRDLVHQIDDVARHLARADDELALGLVGDLGGQRQDLAVEVLPLAGVAHERSKLVVVEVLGDVVVGAVLHRLHGGLDLVDGRDHDDLDQAVVFLDDPQHLEAADAGQPDVEQHEVDVFAVQDGEGRFAARDPQHAELALENGRQGVPHPLIVVDDEHGFGLLAHCAWGGRPGGIVSGG